MNESLDFERGFEAGYERGHSDALEDAQDELNQLMEQNQRFADALLEAKALLEVKPEDYVVKALAVLTEALKG